MADILSITAPGAYFYDSAATWQGGVVPAKGDGITIATGVQITVRDARAIGKSTATADVVINGTGQLIIDPAAGGHLTVYGSITGNNTSITRLTGAGEGTSSVHRLVIKSGVLAGDKGLVFDSSDSAAGTKYGYKVAGSNLPNNGVWVHGTDDTHRAYVGANMGASGGCGYLYSRNGFNTAIGNVDTQFVNLANLGDATTPMLDVYINTTSGVSMSNFTSTNGGQFTNGTAPPSGSMFEMLDGKFSGTLSSVMCGISFNNAPGTGTFRFWRCVFDKRFVGAGNLNGVDFYRSTFGQGLDYAVNKKPTIRECAIRNTTAGGVVPGNGQAAMKEADVTDCIFHIPDTGLGNTKWFTLSGSSVPSTIDGAIVDVESADGTGEMVSIVGAPAALQIATLKRILMLPSGIDATKRPENIVSVASASANWDIRFEHNTGFADAEGIMSYSETSISPVGQITSLRNNIAYGLRATPSLVGQSGTLLGIDWRTGGTTTIDAVVPSAYAGNVGYNLATYAGRYGFSGAFSVAPAQEIVSANPQFADMTRRLKTWDASLGGAGTNASAWTRLEGNPNLIRTAYDWIRDGFRPTNEALRGAATDGTTPGAVEMAAPTGTPLVAPVLQAASGITARTASLGWSAATGGTAPYTYQVQTSPTGTSGWTNAGAAISATAADLVALTPGATVYVRVVATDGAAATATSNVISFVTDTALAAPTLSEPSAIGASGATFTFGTATHGTPGYGYQLQRSPAGAGTWTSVAGATASPATDTSASAGVAYDYSLLVTDAAGDTARSNTRTLTTPAVTAVSVSPSAPSLQTGATQTLTATVTAIGGASTGVTWSTSNPNVATVDATTGLVTAVAVGSATITATSVFNPARTGTAAVTVTAPPGVVTGVSVSLVAPAIAVGATLPLSAIVSGTNSPSQSVTWSSSDPTVATVDAAGVVTGVAAGTAVITARSASAPAYSSAAIVTVGTSRFVPPPTLRERLMRGFGGGQSGPRGGGHGRTDR